MLAYLARSKRIVAIIIAVFSISIWWHSRACAQEAAGTISSLVGTATLHRGGSRPVVVGMAVHTGDRIKVGAGSKVTIALSDGSKLEAGASSTVVIDEELLGTGDAHGSTRVGLLSGFLRAVVKHTSSGALPNFEVHTPNAVAAARGTDFEVDFIEGKPCPVNPSCMVYTTVGVYRGVVEVTNPTSPAGAPGARATAGYQTNVPCAIPPTAPGPWGVEELGAPGYH
jgi:hypothetical protein